MPATVTNCFCHCSCTGPSSSCVCATAQQENIFSKVYEVLEGISLSNYVDADRAVVACSARTDDIVAKVPAMHQMQQKMTLIKGHKMTTQKGRGNDSATITNTGLDTLSAVHRFFSLEEG